MKKGQISRRGFLIGGGATLALPMLESVVPFSKAYAQTLPAPRLLIVTYGNGLGRGERVYPAEAHLSALDVNKFSEYIKPLASLKNYFSIVGNMHNSTASYPCDFIGGGHGGAAASLLTCGMVYPKESNGNLPLAGPSVDQFIAQSLYASRGSMAALVLGTPDGNDNVESWGYPYVRYTSYRKDNVTGKIENAPLITNPRSAFDQVMAAAAPPVTPPTSGGGPHPLQKLVDFILSDAKDLRRKVSKGDQVTLDRYLADIDDLQRSIASTQPNPNPSPQPLTCNGTAPTVPGTLWWDSHPTTVDQMNDIVKLAFQCDRTRVINYAMGQCQSVINFNRFGLKTSSGQTVMDKDHHGISHTHEVSGEENFRMASMRAIVGWYSTKFASLLTKLKDTPDPVFGGTLLDNTMILFMSELSSGHDHYGNHLPVILAGGGAGTLTNQGKYLAYTNRTHTFTCTPHDGNTYNNQVQYSVYPELSEWVGYPISSLYLTLMQKMGVKGSNGQLITSFRDSVGTINIG